MQKLDAQKYIRNINDNVVQDRLSENYLFKYFRREIFVIYGTLNYYCSTNMHIMYLAQKHNSGT